MVVILNNKQILIDPEDLQLLQAHTWYIANGRYVRAHIKGKMKQFHRLIMRVDDGMQVDHINGNTLDNRKENLRICSGIENSWNQKKHKRNKSGYKGVYWYPHSSKWRVQIGYKGKHIHLGTFSDVVEAAKVYDNAAKKYFGKFARTNF